MADLQQFAVVSGGPANVVVPTHLITGQLVEGSAVLADFTGANAIRWPSVLALLPVELQNEIANDVATKVINGLASQG